MNPITAVRVFWALIALVALILAYFLVLPSFFPALGITLLLLAMSILAFESISRPGVRTWFYYGLCLILSLFIVLRANPTLVFLDFMVVLLFGALLINRYRLLKNPFTALWSVPQAISRIFLSPLPPFPWNPTKKGESNQLGYGSALGITLLVMVLIIPPLIAANPLLEYWVKQIIPNLTENIVVNISRIGVFTLLVWFLPKLVSTARKPPQPDSETHFFKLLWWVPKIAVVVILGLFFVSQFRLYTMSSAELQAVGITHSQRTREIFGQLIWVAFVTSGLIFMELRPKQFRWLNALLIVQAFALTLIALNSDLSYISAWGLTHKRLYGLTLVLWLWGLGGLMLAATWKQWFQIRLIELVLVLSGVVLLLVNLANFDYLIAHSTTLKTHEGIDYYYLSTLSADAHSYKDQIEVLEQKFADNTGQLIDPKLYYALSLNVRNVRYLQHKFSRFDPRRFNLSEYREYQNVKSIDLAKYDAMLQKYSP